MNNQLIALKLCTDKIGGFSMAKFNDRLVFQKKVYLMQLFGVDLGYRFEWYLRGPYCSDLTAMGFEIDMHKNEVEAEAKDYTLSKSVEDKLNLFKDMISEPPAEGLTQELWLELLASMHFLARIAYTADPEEKEYGKVSEKLINMKPWYNAEQTKQAWELLQKYGLLTDDKVKG